MESLLFISDIFLKTNPCVWLIFAINLTSRHIILFQHSFNIPIPFAFHFLSNCRSDLRSIRLKVTGAIDLVWEPKWNPIETQIGTLIEWKLKPNWNANGMGTLKNNSIARATVLTKNRMQNFFKISLNFFSYMLLCLVTGSQFEVLDSLTRHIFRFNQSKALILYQN